MAGVFVVTNKDKFFEQMRLEHNKSEKEYEQCLDILSEWADTQKHFPEKPDRYILRYVLLSNKFSIERSKEKLDMYYSVRNLMPEIFSKHPLSPEFIKESRVNYAIPMPKPGPGYKRIVYCQHNPEFGAEYFYPEKFLIHILHVAELIFHTDDCCNYHFIYDCNGLTLGHVPRFSLVVMKKVGFLLDEKL
ncbi:uncharacterized protein LOC115890709 [Sitophilus oryzae]|uniref:Uncharacterized protein LOC115890709 n=1 Tax=Sitophilus oryzae TaxID=7048 RepID=A0A6J2YU99_SITOR|nr:uncharacterized protein LOC115890709 [Sitophilus oryzae]